MLIGPMVRAGILLAKHTEFETAAARMKGARRSIVKTPRGVRQHVVETPTSVLRWPVHYGTGPPKVRYESLSPIHDAESDRVVAELREELEIH